MSKMLDEFMKRFEQNVVEGKENVEAREAAEKKAADEAALEEQRLIKEEQELLERRRTRLGELAANLKYLPMVEKIIDLHYLADGITVFARTTDGNAYEFMIRPAEYAKGFSNYRKPSKPVKEEQSAEPQFPSSTRVRELTREIANAYGGMYDWRYPRVWTRFPMGVRNRDPEHWVKFKTPEALEAAWEDLSTKGKVMHIKDSMIEKAKPHIKIGKFIIGRAGNSLYVQTTSILRNTPIRKQEAAPVKEEQINELSDKRLKKYVKKATKSADALQYYSDSRTDPDWEKAQKRKKMVDVAKKKLGEETERERAERYEIEYYNELKQQEAQNEIRKHRAEERKRMKKAFDYTPKKWVKENSSDAARIVVKPSDLTHPDDDGAVERAPKDKDVSKSIKDTSRRYDVHVVKDFEKYTKNK